MKTSQNSAKNANRNEKKSVRQQMIDEMEFNTVNMKLNLDAIEINSQLPKSTVALAIMCSTSTVRRRTTKGAKRHHTNHKNQRQDVT